jgi:hypothetical protein
MSSRSSRLVEMSTFNCITILKDFALISIGFVRRKHFHKAKIRLIKVFFMCFVFMEQLFIDSDGGGI